MCAACPKYSGRANQPSRKFIFDASTAAYGSNMAAANTRITRSGSSSGPSSGIITGLGAAAARVHFGLLGSTTEMLKQGVRKHIRILHTPDESGPSSSLSTTCVDGISTAACSLRALRAASPRDCAEEESCADAQKDAQSANPNTAVTTRIVATRNLIGIATNSPASYTAPQHQRSFLPGRCSPAKTVGREFESARAPQPTTPSAYVRNENV